MMKSFLSSGRNRFPWCAAVTGLVVPYHRTNAMFSYFDIEALGVGRQA
jgi:hypothetical protein